MLKKVIYSIMWMIDKIMWMLTKLCCCALPVLLSMALLLAVVYHAGMYIPSYLTALYLLIGVFLCVCVAPLKDKASVEDLVCLVAILLTWPVLLTAGIAMTVFWLMTCIYKWVRVWCGLDLER